ncbi:MAG: hypothetical protein LBT09_01665 [Planctomycetaceae bacterium]|jgi:hypothetical protein|nr:hypothetical protein [Planctomycetaceae bacterium]
MLLRQIFSAVLFLLLLNFLTAIGVAQKVSDSMPKRVPATDFIIFPWGGMPLGDVDSGVWGDIADADMMMKDLFDCGFNATGFAPAKHIKSAIAHNLAVILYDSRINPQQDVTAEKANEIVQTILKEIPTPEERKAVYSFYIIDEPNSSLFTKLNLWSDAVKKQGALPYINLFPDYANSQQLGSKNYEEHIDSFVRSCQPSYLSYDNYSLFNETELNESRFYNNLETIRKKSLQYNVPFWNVILGNAHFHYAEPSAATFNIQVYSTLAYGGKGIGYFTYYTPSVGNYRLAPIDQLGYRTKTWNALRHINLQIHSLASVYCQLKSVNVFHVQNVPKDGRGKDSTVHLKSINNGQFLVGEFVDAKGNPYVLAVNKNLKSSVELNVAFKKAGKTMLISPYNKGKIPHRGEQRWLAPGAGVLLTVE